MKTYNPNLINLSHALFQLPDWLGSLIVSTFLLRIVLTCDPQNLENRIPTPLQMARLGDVSCKLLLKLFE